jgi:hypothetical protein
MDSMNTQLNAMTKITRESFSKPLIDIINTDVFDNDAARGVSSGKEYQVDINQRFPRWDKKSWDPLVDSIMHDFPMSTLLMTQSVVLFEGESNNVNWIEDGQTRLSILQDFIKGKFTWRDKHYSDFTESERSRFNNYLVRVELIKKKPSVSTDEFNNIKRTIFGRINSGKPLTDSDKFHNCMNEPVLKLLMAIKFQPDLYSSMKKLFGDIGGGKSRSGLANMVGVVLSLVTGNNDCITPSYTNNSLYVISDNGTAVNITEPIKEKVKTFFRWYITLADEIKELVPLKKIKPGFFKKISGFLALTLSDYNDGLANNRRDMWIHHAIQYHKDENYERRIYKLLDKGTIQNNSAVNFRKRILCILSSYKGSNSVEQVSQSESGEDDSDSNDDEEEESDN